MNRAQFAWPLRNSPLLFARSHAWRLRYASEPADFYTFCSFCYWHPRSGCALACFSRDTPVVFVCVALTRARIPCLPRACPGSASRFPLASSKQWSSRWRSAARASQMRAGSRLRWAEPSSGSVARLSSRKRRRRPSPLQLRPPARLHQLLTLVPSVGDFGGGHATCLFV